MDLTSLSPRVPVFAAMLQVPWFILLSIARVRMGGTSALPVVKLIDLCIPLPAFFGLVVAVVLLPRHGASGGLWLWGGAVACAGISALFIKVMWS